MTTDTKSSYHTYDPNSLAELLGELVEAAVTLRKPLNPPEGVTGASSG